MTTSPRGAQRVTDSSISSLIARRHRSLGPAYRLFYDDPLQIVKGEGVWLIDVDGRRYLDMYNNVPHVGHCHPHVVAAIRKQVGVLNTHTRYLHAGIVDYAERLLATFPEPLSVAMFSCTGSEANELALRVARAATGAQGIIVIEDAYHGTSQVAFDMSTEDNPRELWPAHLEAVPAPNAYAGKYQGRDAGAAYAQLVSQAIDRLAERGYSPAAFVIDTIASSSGVIELPDGFLRLAADAVRAAGGVFIADEVQPGFGRTGRNFWGFESEGVVPDIVTLGKPMANGHPVAATILRRPLVDTFAERFGYFNTFGGNPVSAAAAAATLDVIEEEQLQQNALVVGGQLRDAIVALAPEFPMIGDVRGHGLFLGIDLVDDSESKRPATQRAKRIVNRLRSLGVLTNTIGPAANVLKLRPPLCFSTQDAEYFMERLSTALSAEQ